jgi:uncharacterized protein with GYD domain
MATYFMFGKYSIEGAKGISAVRTESGSKLIEKSGGKVQSIYALMGEKDIVVIATFPDSISAMKASIALSKLTGITFTTCEAISVKEFDAIASET